MKNFYRRALFFILACTHLSSLEGYGQFYYKDIISTRQINETFRVYTANKVTGVKLNTFNGNTPITEGFLCEQKVSYRPNKLVTYTKTSDEGESFLTTTYNAEGLIVRSTDSAGQVVSTSSYQYNPARQLIELKNESRAADNSSVAVEIHTWIYNEAGKPVKMIRTRNGSDTTLVKFTNDEKGNIGEEESFRKNISLAKVYYYYDDKNRLTDVVRYNERAKRLMPDYEFEYEENNALASMTLTPQTGAKLQKWFYKYDDNGLKLADFCYNLQEQLQGKVEYEYDF
ncbi:MAG: hypothetical protein H7Y03_13085 [Chitinophagaceae bacterium]|nr:hypothetical protein [Chitinophagaceae bacterium]